MLDNYEYLRFYRTVEWCGGIGKIVHDVPEFREMLTPVARISMEQILHRICSDFLVIATWHSIFDLLRRSAGQGTLLVHDTNKFQSRFCSRLIANVAIRARLR